MIVDTAVPFEWADNIHPINQLGYFYFGIADGFKFNKEKVENADELFLWKLYGLIQNYWLIHYREWKDKKTNLICNMRNYIKIEQVFYSRKEDILWKTKKIKRVYFFKIDKVGKYRSHFGINFCYEKWTNNYKELYMYLCLFKIDISFGYKF